VVFINERERIVRLDAIGKIWIPGRDKDEVALKAALLINFASAENLGVKAIVLAEVC